MVTFSLLTSKYEVTFTRTQHLLLQIKDSVKGKQAVVTMLRVRK